MTTNNSSKPAVAVNHNLSVAFIHNHAIAQYQAIASCLIASRLSAMGYIGADVKSSDLDTSANHNQPEQEVNYG